MRAVPTMIQIDGSQGEGGGQVVRTSLTWAILLQRPVRLVNMRANRDPPGLRPQHMAAVRAAAAVCGADVSSAHVGSRTLEFRPGPVQPGRHSIDIGTAGSTGLVLQTIALPLAASGRESEIRITGGTHNPLAPSFDYLEYVWTWWLRRIGIPIEVTMHRAGFFPKGGGCITCWIGAGAPAETWRPLRVTDRGSLLRVSGRSCVANLPESIAQRQRSAALRDLGGAGLSATIDVTAVPSPGQGTTCFLGLEFERSRAGFFGLGARGKRAEVVGAETADQAIEFVRRPGSVDPFAADQLMVVLARVSASSCFSTTRLTRHAQTNAAVIRQMAGRELHMDGALDEPGRITIE